MVNMANLRPTTLVEMFAIIDHVPTPYLQTRPRKRVVKRVVELSRSQSTTPFSQFATPFRQFTAPWIVNCASPTLFTLKAKSDSLNPEDGDGEHGQPLPDDARRNVRHH